MSDTPTACPVSRSEIAEAWKKAAAVLGADVHFPGYV